ncbi:GTPase Obg [Penicillium maclennaniae]|uniref:GTPase Obg n=1 Tax=Penicillium maclennaniae TaxID=1343394 RepID=UPI002541E9E3|nr:GTPase Obg [Penicillium maclennaniae]KAJ5676665.1 GTPase Obg [Penicillium maclennaniae]
MAYYRACLSIPKGPLAAGRTSFVATRFLRLPVLFCQRWQSTTSDNTRPDDDSHETADLSHLNPEPEDYSRFIFQDKCHVTMFAGAGGNGCAAYLREKYVEEGPPNGGDGGSGGGLYIQAVEGLTSLHKLARRGVIKAGRGKNGQGKSKGGKRGDDVLIQVPIGTVVREVDRYDPVTEELARLKKSREEPLPVDEDGEVIDFQPVRHDRWVLHPGANPADFLTVQFPRLKPRRQAIAAMEPQAPIYLDLSQPMDKPMLLAAGGAGGLGNPHFVTRSMGRPKFASRGEGGMKLELDFELKLLADVGLVGKPNAGKSTLLRSLTNSRTRIGNWEFTTLSPSIGTVIIDDNRGRPLVESKRKRTHFTIADIPGLVEGAHLDRGLGLGFLRHIDRAGILAFVLDLSNGNPVEELRKLWHELGEYERMRNSTPEPTSEKTQGVIDWDASGPDHSDDESMSRPLNYPSTGSLPPLTMPPLHTKPWFVVATKADLEHTQDQYRALQEYLSAVQNGTEEHPSGHQDGWKEKLTAVPVSAIKGQGVSRIPKLVMEFLE